MKYYTAVNNRSNLLKDFTCHTYGFFNFKTQEQDQCHCLPFVHNCLQKQGNVFHLCYTGDLCVCSTKADVCNSKSASHSYYTPFISEQHLSLCSVQVPPPPSWAAHKRCTFSLVNSKNRDKDKLWKILSHEGERVGKLTTAPRARTQQQKSSRCIVPSLEEKISQTNPCLWFSPTNLQIHQIVLHRKKTTGGGHVSNADSRSSILRLKEERFWKHLV